MASKSCVHKFEDYFRSNSALFSRYKVGSVHLTPFRIRNTEDDRILNLRVRQQDSFNLSGTNVFAVTDLYVLFPS
jgi:hypothetical protein